MFLRRFPALLSGSLAMLALCGVMAGQAQARVFIGIGVPLFFPPVVVPPPAYYPPYYGPPVVYAPPGNNFSYTPGQPQNLAPSRGYTPSDYSAQSCRAAAYVCPLVQDTPPGGACACPGHDGQRIRGQAN